MSDSSQRVGDKRSRDDVEELHPKLMEDVIVVSFDGAFRAGQKKAGGGDPSSYGVFVGDYQSGFCARGAAGVCTSQQAELVGCTNALLAIEKLSGRRPGAKFILQGDSMFTISTLLEGRIQMYSQYGKLPNNNLFLQLKQIYIKLD